MTALEDAAAVSGREFGSRLAGVVYGPVQEDGIVAAVNEVDRLREHSALALDLLRQEQVAHQATKDALAGSRAEVAVYADRNVVALREAARHAVIARDAVAQEQELQARYDDLLGEFDDRGEELDGLRARVQELESVVASCVEQCDAAKRAAGGES